MLPGRRVLQARLDKLGRLGLQVSKACKVLLVHKVPQALLEQRGLLAPMACRGLLGRWVPQALMGNRVQLVP